MDFFLMVGKNKKEGLVAFAPENIDTLFFVEEMEGKDHVPYKLVIRKSIILKDGISYYDLNDSVVTWDDLLSSNLIAALMSSKLRSIIEDNLLGNEDLEWLTVLISGFNEEKEYYIPRFKRMLNVLDINRSKFVANTNHIIKPVFSRSKLENISIFHTQNSGIWKIGPIHYVSKTLKDAIEKAKIKDFSFSKIEVV